VVGIGDGDGGAVTRMGVAFGDGVPVPGVELGDGSTGEPHATSADARRQARGPMAGRRIGRS
jgi:hypothetical protein